MAIDQKRASDLAATAFEHWQAGRLNESAESYAAALAVADPGHYRTPVYHGEFASVLSALERNHEAISEFRTALTLEELQSGSDSSATRVARYFLGEQYLKMDLAAEALATVSANVV